MDILINAKAKYELQYKNTIPGNLVFWDVTTCPGEKLYGNTSLNNVECYMCVCFFNVGLNI